MQMQAALFCVVYTANFILANDRIMVTDDGSTFTAFVIEQSAKVSAGPL
jgi:hypothetical protein